MPISSVAGLAGRVLAGRYQLNRRLAEGAMGSIWLAKHLTLGVSVAVKIMNDDGASRVDLRKRFEQEARAVALLRSPNVVQIIDYGAASLEGEEGDLPFIVMELLEGVDLLTLVQSFPKWPVSEVANLIVQVARGLEAAHALGLIHRDVKPGNIFLVESSGEVIVKLLDFGIAKWTGLQGEQNLTDANVVLGSPYYMSPEQLRCLPLDGRADLWALTVVAYRLITGELPFVGRDGPEIASKILSRNRKAISPPIPRALELEKFMTRAFSDDPAMRFANAREFADQFILVAGVPSALKIAEKALSSDDEIIIPTLNQRADASSDALIPAREVKAPTAPKSAAKPLDLKAPPRPGPASAPRPAPAVAPSAPRVAPQSVPQQSVPQQSVPQQSVPQQSAAQQSAAPAPASSARQPGIPRPQARTERMLAVDLRPGSSPALPPAPRPIAQAPAATPVAQKLPPRPQKTSPLTPMSPAARAPSAAAPAFRVPVIRDSNEDSVTNLIRPEELDTIDPPTHADDDEAPSPPPIPKPALVGSFEDEAEDTVTDLPFPGSG